MRRLLLLLCFVLSTTVAWGHPMPSTSVILRMQRTQIQADLILPVIELKMGWDKPFPLNDAQLVIRDYGDGLKQYVHDHIRPMAPDGRPWTVTLGRLTPVLEQTQDVKVEVTMTPPPGAPVDKLTFGYDVILHHLITHTAIVSIASDWQNGVLGDKPIVLGTLWDTAHTLTIDRSKGSWFRGFAGVFQLGMRHIAEGTDHLLFLLALLLPAPLLVAGNRWGGYAGGKKSVRRIVKVVSAFTVGHSITLIFGALGWVHLPGSVIESAIAVSIFVSALHALVPIFRGKEVLIAGGFGLMHGLAFAATLAEFGFDPLTMVTSVFAFNLGIEAFQLFVILVTMPWLVLLARTRVYPPLRIVGASLTGIAAGAWFVERAFGWTNPVGPLVERAASSAVWLVIGLAIVAVAANVVPKMRLAPSHGETASS